MESTSKNLKTREEVGRMVDFAFDGASIADSADAFRELKDGWFNAAYQVTLDDGRDVVLKIAPAPDVEVMTYESDLMTTEVACMHLVSANPAIPVPKIYAYDDSCERCDSPYFFMDKIEGDDLKKVKDALAVDVQDSVERQIGEIVREVNGFRGGHFGYDGNPNLQADTWREAFVEIVDSVLCDAAARNVVMDHSAEEIRSAVLRCAQALDEVTEPVLVHWDAWDSNFFVRDDSIVGIIDFERALWADPLMEAQFRPFVARNGTNHYARGYGTTSFTPMEELRCHLYTLHLGLVMHTECSYRDYPTNDVLEMSKFIISMGMDGLT